MFHPFRSIHQLSNVCRSLHTMCKYNLTDHRHIPHGNTIGLLGASHDTIGLFRACGRDIRCFMGTWAEQCTPHTSPHSGPLMEAAARTAGGCCRPQPAEIDAPHFLTLPHTQGLEWMLRREQQGDAVGRSLLRLAPGWAQLVTEEGHVLYLET